MLLLLHVSFLCVWVGRGVCVCVCVGVGVCVQHWLPVIINNTS